MLLVEFFFISIKFHRGYSFLFSIQKVFGFIYIHTTHLNASKRVLQAILSIHITKNEKNAIFEVILKNGKVFF